MSDETVLIGSFSHETNTFATEPTTREDFRTRLEAVGDEIPAELRGTNTAVGGAIAAADEENVDLVYSMAASATPGGPVTTDAYEFYSRAIVEAATEHADDIDGVFLALHGAMVPEGRDDGEGPLISAVREAVGELPIVVTLDLHGNVTDEMVAAADAIVAFRSYPHVDMGETGRRGMSMLSRAVRGEITPAMAVERPPVLAFGPKQNTREGPMAELMASARAIEAREGVLTANVMPGFHAADIPSMGASVSVVADGDPELAREAAREIAVEFWTRREEFVADYPTPEEAVDRAFERFGEGHTEDGPIVLADTGDNPGGGSAADGTAVLRALLEHDRSSGGASDPAGQHRGVGEDPSVGLALIRDPEVVTRCVEAGVGETVVVTLGGKTDDHHGEPIEGLEGYVKAITDGEFENTGPMGTGTHNDLGRAIRLECGDDRNVTVIVTENRLQPLDAELFRHVGVQPERLDVLVVKSMNHFRADYEPLASEVIPINSPGLSTMDPRRYEYDRIRRPQFPIDEVAGDEYP